MAGRHPYLPPIGSETTQVSQGRKNLDPDNESMATGRIGTIGHEAVRTEIVPN